MIAKIGRGNNLYGALVYNQLKVEKIMDRFLYTNKIIQTPDGSYATSQLFVLLNQNHTPERLKTIYLSILIQRDKVSDEQFEKREFVMQKWVTLNSPGIPLPLILSGTIFILYRFAWMKMEEKYLINSGVRWMSVGNWKKQFCLIGYREKQIHKNQIFKPVGL
jgi:hypothetical protein